MKATFNFVILFSLHPWKRFATKTWKNPPRKKKKKWRRLHPHRLHLCPFIYFTMPTGVWEERDFQRNWFNFTALKWETNELTLGRCWDRDCSLPSLCFVFIKFFVISEVKKKKFPFYVRLVPQHSTTTQDNSHGSHKFPAWRAPKKKEWNGERNVMPLKNYIKTQQVKHGRVAKI